METSSTLPKLMEETELLKMLTDEKMRTEQHKTNYQILKIEHSRLQNENIKLQSELKTSKEDNVRITDANKKETTHYRKDIADLKVLLQLEKSAKIDSEENFRAQIKVEMDQLYKEKYTKMESEADKYRDDFNKLRYDFTFLKSEYDYLQQENSRVLEERRLKYEADVSHLQKEIQVLQSKKSTELSYDSQQLQKLRRENSHSGMKIKSLLSELDNIKSQEIKSKLQDDEILKMMNKQLAESSEKIRSLESENNSLLFVKDGLKNELSLNREQSASLSSELSSAQQEINRLKNIIEETKHSYKLQETDLKIEFAKNSNEYERELNRLSAIIQEHKVELEVLRNKCEKQGKIILEKEQEIETHRQAGEDKEFLKITQLETEKSNIELDRDNLQRRLKEMDQQHKSEMKYYKDQISATENEVKKLKQENQLLKNMKETSEKLSEDLEILRNDNYDKQQQIDRFIAEHNSLIEVQSELIDQRTTLKNALEKINSELQGSQRKIETLNEKYSHEEKKLNQKLILQENDFQKRLDQLKNDSLIEAIKNSEELHELKNKNKQYSRLILKLRNKLELNQAKVEELEIQKEVFSKSIPKHEYDQVKKKLKALEKRHSEFRTVLAFGSESGLQTIPLNRANNWDHSLRPEEHRLQDLRLRLENFDQQQRNEIEDLQNFNKNT